MQRIVLWVVCLCMMGAGVVYAEEPLSLEAALGVAVQANPLIKAGEENVTMTRMDKQAALAKMLPSVTLSYGYLRLNENPNLSIGQDIYLPVLNEQKPPRFDGTGNIALDLATGRPLVAYIPDQSFPLGTQDNYQLSVEATQVLYAGGALFNNYRVARNTERISAIDKLKDVRDLKSKVIEAYYSVIAARQGLTVAKEAVASVNAHVGQAQAFFKAGVIPKNDLLTAQVKSAETQQSLITAERWVQTFEAGFNVALARPISTPVVIEGEIPEPPLEGPLETLIETALKNRQEIKTLELQADSARMAVNTARGSFSPRVAATYKYERKGEESDIPEASWSVGVGLQWTLLGPLAEGGTSLTNLTKAKAARLGVEYLLQGKKDEVTLQVKSDYLVAQEAKAKMEVGIMAIEQATENLRILKHKYNLQAATSTDVLDGQTMLNKAKTDYITARAEYATAIAKLHASMGIL